MADNFQSSKVASNELSSSAKFNNFVQAVEDAVNSLDNSNISAAAAIVVSKLAAGSNGDTLQTVAGVPVWTSGAGAPGYATTLPGSPTNGQEAILVDSTTNPTYAWSFRYNSSSAHTDKWEFIGGADADVEVETSQSTSSVSYVDLATVGPSFTLPRAGVYTFGYGASVIQSADDNGVRSVALFGAAELDRIEVVSSYGSRRQVPWKCRRVAGLTGSQVVKLQYLSSVGSGTFERRRLTVRPVRVS